MDCSYGYASGPLHFLLPRLTLSFVGTGLASEKRYSGAATRAASDSRRPVAYTRAASESRRPVAYTQAAAVLYDDSWTRRERTSHGP